MKKFIDSKILERLNKFFIYLGVFLIPLFFLALTRNVLGYAKQYLLLILTVLALATFLIKQLVEGKFVFRPINKKFYYFGFLILFSFGLSVFLSLWQSASFWGLPLTISDGLVSLIVFLVFGFLIPQVIKSREELFFMIKLLLLSAGLVAILSLFQLYGVFLLPFDFAKVASFTLVGSIFGEAIFAAVLLPLALAFVFLSQKRWKIFLIAISALLFLNVLLVNSRDAWIVLMFSVIISLLFSTRAPDNKINWVWAGFLMLFLICSLFFIFSKAPLPGFPISPLEVTLSSGSEYFILSKIFGQGTKSAIFGTGPSTFVFDYSQFRSPTLNQSIFWGTRFAQGNSTFLDWVATKGILGGLSLVLLWVLVIFVGFKKLIKEKLDKISWTAFLGLFSALFGLIVAHFIYPLSFSLLFLFWVLLGVFLAMMVPKIKANRKMTSTLNAGFSIGLIVVLVLGLGLLFAQGQRYLAEVKYFNGLEASAEGRTNKAISELNLAVKINPQMDDYWRDLAQIYLSQADSLSKDKELAGQEKRDAIQEVLGHGIDSLNEAIEIAPFNVANWNVRGFYYRNLIGVEGAGQLAVEAYKKAIALEPNSPFSYGELGRVNILMAQHYAEQNNQQLAQQALKDAKSNLTQAVGLKPDYAPAHYLMAVVYDQQGQLDEAIANLENTQLISSQDIGVTFQLGLLYWRAGQAEKAKEEFERALELNPSYSNAKYMLALIYNMRGQIDEAKKLFEQVLELNPDSEHLKEILENINQGLPAFQGITPASPPIQQEPPEIRK